MAELIAIIERVGNELRKDRNERDFAVFDFDNSCIQNDIQEALLAYMCRYELLKTGALGEWPSLKQNKANYHRNVFRHYHHLLNMGNVMEAYKFGVRILAGYNREEISKLAQQTILEEGDTLGVAELFGVEIPKGLVVRERVRELMGAISSLGVKIWVVTASSEIVVRAALIHFEFSAECIGVKLHERNGVMMHDFVEPLSVMKGKVDCIKRHISRTNHPILGLGDSMNDFPMLEYSRVPVFINRKNELTRVAEKRNWFILD